MRVAMGSATTMRSASAVSFPTTVRRRGMRSRRMGSLRMSCRRPRASCMRGFVTTSSMVVLADGLSMACLLAALISAPCGKSASAVIASSTIIHKAMSAPAVAIAPARPRPHAQEDSVVEVSRPVEANRRAGIRRVVVVAIRANRLDTDVNDDLCIRSGRQCAHRSEHEQSARQHCMTGAKSLESAHV